MELHGYGTDNWTQYLPLVSSMDSLPSALIDKLSCETAASVSTARFSNEILRNFVHEKCPKPPFEYWNYVFHMTLLGYFVFAKSNEVARLEIFRVLGWSFWLIEADIWNYQYSDVSDFLDLACNL